MFNTAKLIARYLRPFMAAAFLMALPFFGGAQTVSAQTSSHHMPMPMDMPMHGAMNMPMPVSVPAPDCALDCARAASLAVSPGEVQLKERQAVSGAPITQAYMNLAAATLVTGDHITPVYTGSAFRPPDRIKLFVRYLD